MSFLGFVGDIAKAGAEEAVKTGAKYAVSEIAGGGGGSSQRRQAKGLAVQPQKPIRFNETKPSPTQRGKLETAKATKASEVWNKDPVEFTYEWVQSLFGAQS